ncbi:choloylglycine hydrolase [Paratractidigestivibacter sp.]|uniref:choloylglycine hydrolase n=1 Tax=Paratractidigestivibacter sp. TaxID=2847316 RepID=UPI003AB5A3A6
MCTAVRFNASDGGMFMGRNLDWGCGYGQKPRVVPAGFPVTYRFMDDAPAAHAAIGMCVDFQNYPMFFDCGNDAGLAVAGLNFPGFAAYADAPADGKKNVCAFEFPLWIAATFASVDEVEAALANTVIVGESAGEGLGVSYLHWIVGDASRSIVVESRADGMHVLDDPVDVLANQPSLEWHLENLRSYVTVTNEFPEPSQWRGAKLVPYAAGAGMRGIPGDCYSPSRFVKAAYLNASYPEKDSEKDNVIRMFRTLEGVAMVEGAARMSDGTFERTLYTSCFAAKSGRYYWSTYEDPAIRYVSLADAAGAPIDKLYVPEPRLR